MESKILIIMSTYNGQKYIREQLDSLYAQKDVDIHILVRDDGSKDDTVSILQEYRQNYGHMTIHAEENVGAAMSFHTLISYASKEVDKYDYFAYADQDDVWMSDKLVSAVKMLNRSEAKTKLYFCLPELVDAELKILPSKRPCVANNLKGNVVTSHILGCTQVFNGHLLRLVAMYRPNAQERVPLHDGWTALVAYAFDADVIFDTNKYIKYRQHGNNVVGANKSFIEVQEVRFARYFNGQSLKSGKCQLVLEVYSDLLGARNKEILTNCVSYKKSFKTKMKMLFDSGYFQYDFTTNVGVFLMILFNKF